MTKTLGILITMILCLGMPMAAFAADVQNANYGDSYGNGNSNISSLKTYNAEEISTAMQKTCDYIRRTVTEPAISSIGGEWAIIGLARSDAKATEDYFNQYYNNVLNELDANTGVLTKVKYTEYSRLILALTAIGKDVTNVGGYNLLEKLTDYNSVLKQGVNGPVFALIALDSGDYEIPVVKGVQKQSTRELFVDYIIKKEIVGPNGEKGGFALSGDLPDADITAVVIQALSKYQSREDVRLCIERANFSLAKLQLAEGGYQTAGIENLESIAQVIVAKSAMGADASPEIAALMKFSRPDGSFAHVLTGALSGEENLMATEQSLYAMAAYWRSITEKNSLYNMKDVNTIKVLLNGVQLSFSQAPINKNGSILVPMRAIFTALGAEVQWQASTKTVTGRLKDREVIIKIGSPSAIVNGEEVQLVTPAEIVNGNTMVPVRVISEGLAAKVEWQPATKTVLITN